jgi:ribonuclease E
VSPAGTAGDEDPAQPADGGVAGEPSLDADAEGDDAGRNRRRRGRRGGRGRGAGGAGGEGGEDIGADGVVSSPSDAATPGDSDAGEAGGADEYEDDPNGSTGEGGASGTRRRRRRRRRGGSGGGAGATGGSDGVEAEAEAEADPPNTVVHVREPRPPRSATKADDGDGVRGVKGSTRLEAKRQRRRDGRDSGRRRTPVLSEAEFLARREAVERVMVVRQGDERTQIAVLEDGVLVEHYVARKDSASMVGNVYLGKVQNVLPSMEAAFVDIGRGRNAVLYAGEVNYDASMLEGKPARIEQALKSGQSVLVQVTKDPIGHKGSRLTSQVSIPGRYMVYVPDGRVSGISRKLPDVERNRLKNTLKRLMPEEAGVIIRTAAEGADEADLERDLNRLHAQWEDIEKKAKTASAPSLIYSEPDLVIRVIRDVFNEDFTKLIVQGLDEWDTVDNYLRWVAPDLSERSSRWTDDQDVFEAYRVDEQLAKGLDRKVWLPSGGYLVIDRTEAMIVIDVNTGKFTGKGGNLEQTVTKNNLEAAEEIVRQLRLRDLGGIIVIDFIDMVLESNRDLVLRRLTECLGRDRTRHQVAEVTSLGLVQMTRKRVGQGLTEAFSHVCKDCGGSGIIIDQDPVEQRRPAKAASSG